MLPTKQPTQDELEAYYESRANDEHPNVLQMLRCEQWIGSDEELVQAIKLIQSVQQARDEAKHE